MHPTQLLLRYATRLTLFTRPNCSLCDDAKHVLSRIWDKRPFEFTEINVMEQGQKQWKDLYEFDTPVVHVNMVEEGHKGLGTTATARKLMHRFKEEEVSRLIDECVNEPAAE